MAAHHRVGHANRGCGLDPLLNEIRLPKFQCVRQWISRGTSLAIVESHHAVAAMPADRVNTLVGDGAPPFPPREWAGGQSWGPDALIWIERDDTIR